MASGHFIAELEAPDRGRPPGVVFEMPGDSSIVVSPPPEDGDNSHGPRRLQRQVYDEDAAPQANPWPFYLDQDIQMEKKKQEESGGGGAAGDAPSKEVLVQANPWAYFGPSDDDDAGQAIWSTEPGKKKTSSGSTDEQDETAGSGSSSSSSSSSSSVAAVAATDTSPYPAPLRVVQQRPRSVTQPPQYDSSTSPIRANDVFKPFEASEPASETTGHPQRTRPESQLFQRKAVGHSTTNQLSSTVPPRPASAQEVRPPYPLDAAAGGVIMPQAQHFKTLPSSPASPPAQQMTWPASSSSIPHHQHPSTASPGVPISPVSTQHSGFHHLSVPTSPASTVAQPASMSPTHIHSPPSPHAQTPASPAQGLSAFHHAPSHSPSASPPQGWSMPGNGGLGIAMAVPPRPASATTPSTLPHQPPPPTHPPTPAAIASAAVPMSPPPPYSSPRPGSQAPPSTYRPPPSNNAYPAYNPQQYIPHSPGFPYAAAFSQPQYTGQAAQHPPPPPPRSQSSNGPRPQQAAGPPPSFFGNMPPTQQFVAPPKTNYAPSVPPRPGQGPPSGRIQGSSSGSATNGGKLFSSASARKWLNKTTQVIDEMLAPQMGYRPPTNGSQGHQQPPRQGWQPGQQPYPPPQGQSAGRMPPAAMYYAPAPGQLPTSYPGGPGR